MGYLCANFSLPRSLGSRVRPDIRDRQSAQTDVRQKHRLMPPPYGGGDIVKRSRLTVLAVVAGVTGWTATYVRVADVDAAAAISTRSARAAVHIYTQSHVSK